MKLNTRISGSAFADTKPQFEILNGLRGIAALIVVLFHISEAFATSHLDYAVPHGYLAVDFFFILSGFVVGYAYDDRWGKMSIKDFLKRRLIRLHPMVVMGSIIGGLLFYSQATDSWNDVSAVSISTLLFAILIGALLIPATPGMEVRGLAEMFPLNGPSWSLFFEYIGNILYALFLRKLPTKILALIVVAGGIGLARFAIWGPYGDVSAGYALTPSEFEGGIFRLLFAFSAGLLMFRVFKPSNVKGSFWIGTIALVTLMFFPRLGGQSAYWMNGLYETICIIAIFPLLVYLGASDSNPGKRVTAASKFLGDLSYPLYMVHYPFIYLYYAWVKNNNLTFMESIWGAAGVVVGSITLAYVCFKFYDIPVRRYLTEKFLKKSVK